MTPRWMRKVLIVDASGGAARKLRDVALLSGICPHIMVHHEYRHLVAGDTGGWLGRFCSTDLSRLDVAHRDICDYARRESVDGVVTVDEFLVTAVAAAARELGLPGATAGPPDAARNKLTMCQLFATHAVPRPMTHVASTIDEAMALVSAHALRFPLVVKPLDNAGSTGVSVVAHRAGLGRAFANVQNLRKTFPYHVELDRRVLLQEFVEGDEFSIESVVHKGGIHHVAVVRKATSAGTSRVELGHSTPAEVEPDVEDAVRASASEAIAALGVTAGLTHTEIMIFRDGRTFVIEVACRMGGPPLAELVLEATGIDLWRAALDVATGFPPCLEPTRARYAEARFFTSQTSGTVANIMGTAEVVQLADHCELRVKVGDKIAPPSSNRNRLGWVAIAAENWQTVRDRLDAVQAHLRVQVRSRAQARSSFAVLTLGIER